MPYRNTPKLIFPFNDIRISSSFGDHNFYDGEDWGIHLGVDIDLRADTQVFSIGKGTVVYSKLHPGETSKSGMLRNWGGIVIIAHRDPIRKKNFYSLYGHLGKRFVKRGDRVEMGEFLGEIGKTMTESNGLWENEHLHFSIYDGPYHSKVLPGYYNAEKENTKLEYWKDPFIFIKNYNSRISQGRGALK